MFKWLAQGHTTSESRSWDQTPEDLSNFGKGHFGRAELDWRPPGEPGRTEGNVEGSGWWEKGMQKKKNVPNSTVRPKISCHPQGASPSTKGWQTSEWTGRMAESSRSTDYNSGQIRKISFCCCCSWMLSQIQRTDSFFPPFIFLSLSSPILSPSPPPSFSFKSKCMFHTMH